MQDMRTSEFNMEVANWRRSSHYIRTYDSANRSGGDSTLVTSDSGFELEKHGKLPKEAYLSDRI